MSTLFPTSLQMDLPGPIVYTVWSQEQLYELLKLLSEVINKDYIWGSTFREESWEFVNEQIRRKHPHFTVGRMKAKLRHLKRKYRLFSTLLASRGVQWDRRTNAVCTPEEVWAEYVMVSRVSASLHWYRRINLTKKSHIENITYHERSTKILFF